MSNAKSLSEFKNLVGIKFQLYNSLFTSLPFHRIEKTGVLVSMLLVNCEEGYKKQASPLEIIEDFFKKQTDFKLVEEKIDLLFRFVQYVERQVVLFDALEDAAFTNVIDINGTGTMRHLTSEIIEKKQQTALAEKLKDFNIQMVLTAHPTQFYRDAVLGIIHDLSLAINTNNETHIYSYLQQLGRTPFFQKQKPTPYDEAVSLSWYLENIFYHAAGRIVSYLQSNFPDTINPKNPLIRMGFWPGGDRDGNPFVTASITIKVADMLRRSIIKCYYKEIKKLRHRLTFKGVDEAIVKLEKQFYDHLFIPGHSFQLNKNNLLAYLKQIKEQLIYDHNSLFLDKVENLIHKIELFGFHFAFIDIRQDSSIHQKLIDTIITVSDILPKNYKSLSNDSKIEALFNIAHPLDVNLLSDPIHIDTIEVIKAIKTIQFNNGEEGCDRYIISQCNSALNAIEVFGLFLMGGWKRDNLTVDIIPLFETVDDLKNAAHIMETLYSHPIYNQHLTNRNKKQTIMLGFSDGTKDGGYLMANWCIYKAKEELTSISKKYNIDVVFFDGRGGPPARGGGKTHKFYASMGKNIANKEIQLTIQGQTVSSNFGTIESAQYNLEQLVHAGISNELFASDSATLSDEEDALLQSLAEESYKSYSELKDHPYFLEYLGHASPLRLYAETNIGSRPAKRGGSAKLNLKDLRAIPFVGAWSQLKQNVTGYYGVGTALQQLEAKGKWALLQQLYNDSLFFRTLIDNCEMAMKKCYFPLTSFLSPHPTYGEIWNRIFNEFELTQKYILKLSNKTELMGEYPVDQLSIQMRERIVLPILTIQQYALSKIRQQEEHLINSPLKASYEKLAMRCSFGIINAGRNSA